MKRILKKTNYMAITSLITFIITLVASIVFIYMSFIPREIYYGVEQPYEVISDVTTVIDGREVDVFHAGDNVYVEQVYCKSGGYPAHMSIILEDGYYETLRIIETSVEPGCYDRVSRTALLPETTPEGTYRIRYRITVQVNHLRTESYEFVSEFFLVENEEDYDS